MKSALLGGPSSLVADVGVVAADYNTVWDVANGDLAKEPGWRGRQVDHAERVRRIQRNIGALAVIRKRNATWIDGLRIVVRTTVSGRLRQTNPLFIAEKARLPVHVRDHNIVIVLAEEQLRAVGGIRDARERTGAPVFGGGGRCIRWDETLKDLSRCGVEYDDRLRRTHQQHSRAMGHPIWIQRNGLGSYRRTQFNDLPGWCERLVVRRDNRTILLWPYRSVRTAHLGYRRFLRSRILPHHFVLWGSHIKTRIACLRVRRLTHRQRRTKEHTN